MENIVKKPIRNRKKNVENWVKLAYIQKKIVENHQKFDKKQTNMNKICK